MPGSPFPHSRSPDSEKLLYQFDYAWQSGKPPRIEDFLEQQPAADRQFLEELVKIDLECRWCRAASGQAAPAGSIAERPRLEDYVARYPQLGGLDALAIDLIGAEYRVRQRWGDRPQPAEYAARFAKQGMQLRTALAQIDAQLASEGALPSSSLRPVSAKAENRHNETSLFRAVGLQELLRPIVSAADLMDTISQYRLLSPTQLSQLDRTDLTRRYPEARALAKHLLEQNWLTPYQVNHLLQGRGPELVLGAYLLLERLGEGGTGQVFKARHQDKQRTVALKVLRKELLADTEVVGRFFREVQVTSRLNHPNVVRAYDAGPIGATHFLAMDFVEGVDLARMVKQGGPLPVMQACEYIRQAALGLQHAHEQGLVHRDIKPHNLFMSLREATIKVLDMGLARLRPMTASHAEADASSLTPVGAVMLGTADYMAPEQALDFHEVDIRADIYSLGCTFHYLLTGQPPFPGGNLAQKVAKHLNAQPTPVNQLRPDVPPAVAAVVRQMLAKRPEDRYQTPAEVVKAVTALAKTPGRRWTFPALPRRRFLLAGAGSLAFLAGSYLVFWSETPAAAAYRKLLAKRKQSYTSDPVPIWHDFLEFRQQFPQTAQADQATELLRQDLLEYRFLNPGTTEALGATTLASLLPSPLDQLTAEQIPPDKRLPRPPKELVGVVGGPGSTWVAFSPDGKLLATCGGDNLIHLWDGATGRELKSLKGHKGRVRCLAFSPDARTIVSSSEDGALKLWDVAWEKEQGAFSEARREYSFLAFSPDGKALASLSGGDGKLWDVARRRDRLSFKAAANFLAFAPDGKALAVPDANCLKLLNTLTGKEELRVPVAGMHHFIVSFAPDGRTLALTWYGGPVQLFDAVSGKELKTENEGGNYKWLLAFTPDGKTLLRIIPHSAVLWDAALSKRLNAWKWEIPDENRAVLAPDGRHVALVSANGNVYILRLLPPPASNR